MYKRQAELDGSVALGERWRWLWHVGIAHSGQDDNAYVPPSPGGGAGDPGGGPYPGSNARPVRASYYGEDIRGQDRTRFDVRTGVSLATRMCDVQLTWQAVDGDDNTAYAVPWNPRDRSGWVLGCVYRW